MPIYFVKYSKGTVFIEVNLHDKNGDKNWGWHKNQYIHGQGTVINNGELGEFSPILIYIKVRLITMLLAKSVMPRKMQKITNCTLDNFSA